MSIRKHPEEYPIWAVSKDRLIHPLKVVRDSTLEPETKDSVLVIPGETNADKRESLRESLSLWERIPLKKPMPCAACGKSSECSLAPPFGKERWVCKRCWPSEWDKPMTEDDVFWREWETLKKPMPCTACGNSSECAKIHGMGVRHSEVWVCKRCWKTDNQQRRNANIRRGLLRGNPGRLVTQSWPKPRRIRKLEDPEFKEDAGATKVDAWIDGFE